MNNERILKLALDAGLLNYVDNETPRHYFVHGHADLEEVEKFAELVVKETIDEMITQMMLLQAAQMWKYGIDESNNPQFYKIIDRTIQEMLDVAPSKD